MKKLTISEIRNEIKKLKTKVGRTNLEDNELKLLKYFEIKESKQIIN